MSKHALHTCTMIIIYRQTHRSDLILWNLNHIHYISIRSQGETLHLILEETNDGLLELGPKVDRLQDNFVFQFLHVKHFDDVVASSSFAQRLEGKQFGNIIGP